jgi:hypothetical protein
MKTALVTVHIIFSIGTKNGLCYLQTLTSAHIIYTQGRQSILKEELWVQVISKSMIFLLDKSSRSQKVCCKCNRGFREMMSLLYTVSLQFFYANFIYLLILSDNVWSLYHCWIFATNRNSGRFFSTLVKPSSSLCFLGNPKASLHTSHDAHNTR